MGYWLEDVQERENTHLPRALPVEADGDCAGPAANDRADSREDERTLHGSAGSVPSERQ